VIENLSDFKSQKRRVQELAGVPLDSPHAGRQILRRFPYRDGNGHVAYKLRWSTDEPGRKCTWARDPDGRVSGKGDCEPTLYELERVSAVLQAVLCEGERDADTVNDWLAELGLIDYVATTTPNGAADVKPAYLAPLIGKASVLCSGDNDEAGRNYVEKCAKQLHGHVSDLRLLPVPEGVKDWTQWKEVGATAQEFKQRLDAAQPITPPPPIPSQSATLGTASRETRMTDVGNAERFVRLHRENVRYCFPRRSWFVWNGALWALDTENLVMQMAKRAALGIYDEARHEHDDARRQKLAAWGVTSESAARLQAMLDLARSEPGIAIRPDVFDADPWLFGVANGVVDLRTGGLLQPSSEQYLTKSSPARYDPSATCECWLRFLARIFDGDEGLMAYMQQITGYCLTGLTSEQVFFLLWGSGANGKSTLLKVLLKLFGDYGLQVPAETFLSRAHEGGARPDLVRLQGARLAVAIESDEGARLAEGTIKQMTGSDRIAARRLYEDIIEFIPTHKILFATNHKPRVRDNTHAMWRRMRLLPFEVQIPDAEQDPDLGDTLIGELSGILNWALAGCVAWQQSGRLWTPEAVVAATASYRTEQDVLDDFLRERCVRDLESITAFAELRTAYVEWTKEASDKPLSSKALATALQERGFEQLRRRNARHYRGLRLRTTYDEDVPEAQVSVGHAPRRIQPDLIVEVADVGCD